MGGALVAISAPVYWLGLVALYLFANDIGQFPIFPARAATCPFTDDPVNWFTSLILPWTRARRRLRRRSTRGCCAAT